MDAINGDNDNLNNEIYLKKQRDKSNPNDISVDSLDMSLDTSKLLLKCTEKDNKNYTIAFEGSIAGSQVLSDSNPQQRSRSNRSDFSDSDYLSNEVNNRKMTKSEHSTQFLPKNRTKDQINRNLNKKSGFVLEIDKSVEKLTQSIPDMNSMQKMNSHYRLPYCPVSGFIPLYDLQSSQSSNSHSSGSEFSPPRSLVRMFIQNRSPLSSQPISPALSYESRSQESTSGNASDSFRPIYYNILELTREANNNILLENRTPNEDQKISFDDNFSKNKMRFDLKQTFPIKEVDENISDSSTDINMTSVETNLSDLNKNPLNMFTNIQNENNIRKESEKYSFCANPHQMSTNTCNSNTNRSGIQMHTRFGVQNMNSAKKQRIYSSISNTRTASTQHSPNIQSLTGDHFTYPKPVPTNAPILTPESPNDPKKAFYVYYPNYSLPDLSFLEQIIEEKSSSPQTIYISPTKYQTPNRNSVSVQMRQNSTSKSRPKSLTDFENLSKQNFEHIKDWDSLNILLPNEFKELFQKTNNVSNIRNDANLESDPKCEETLFNVNANNVRMRSHRSNGQLASNTSVHSNRTYVRNKRYSLQEYPYSRVCEPRTDCHNNSHNMPTSCMTRSTTMPDYHNSCHCHQYCCHTCCHSCCRTPRQSPSTDKPFGQTSFGDINTNSIDKLCQLLAMDLSFKKLMNIINGPNVPPNRSNLESVVETKENPMNSNVNNNMVQDLDQKSSTSEGEESLQFKELKKRWESLATVSPTDVKFMANGSNTDYTNKDFKTTSNQTSSNLNKNSVKPEIARKPKLVLRRPQSSIPRPTTLNTENPTHSHRKSLIPVPKSGQTKSPVVYAPKIKSKPFH